MGTDAVVVGSGPDQPAEVLSSTIKGNEISARLFDGRELISWRTLNLRTGEVNTDQGIGNICRQRARWML